ncbi:hypothetical protein [Kitasatospora sp. NPDC094016]|uniref:ATP dependent DNA ligase n=1 Tax=Kitasatospora sp. NPDC094016 TaxID=3154986 RepID=UPI00332C4B8D
MHDQLTRSFKAPATEHPMSPFTTGASLGLARGTEVRFVRPELHAEVEFLELTDSGRLRQPVWRGLRD